MRSLGEDGIDTHDVVEIGALDDATRARVQAIASSRAPADVVVRAFTRPTRASLVLDVDARAPALVVVQELYAAGWTATIDDAPASIAPVNLVARGVVVPVGAHRIEMRYVAPGFPAGAALSAVAALLAAVTVVVTTRRRRAP